jgi:predicted nucleic acid-binding protein
MHKTIISDTSCLIVLSNINELHLLQKIYGSVITTKEVLIEYGQALPEWIEVHQVSNNKY